jgi:capsular polysaccharide transport system permease protein
MATREILDKRGTLLPPEPQTSLARASRVAQALSEVARRSRFSTRRRGGMGGGFGARRGERFFRMAIKLSFLLIVVVPSTAATAYFALFAADQYVSEARFTVAGGAAPVSDNVGTLTGIPSLQTLQEAEVVANYIQSRAMVDGLSRRLDLRAFFTRPEADWIARLAQDPPIEKLERYWKWMTDVSVSLPGGIVSLTVRSFRPGDAEKLAAAVVELSEKMVNDMNDRMHRDTVALATSDLQVAGERVKVTNVALEKARNEEKMLDAGHEADSFNSLKASVQSTKIKLQQQYDSQTKFISPQASQMRGLKARIDAANVEIAKIDALLTARDGTVDGTVISASMTRLEGLELERQVAEQEYASAALALERAQIAAESKLIYLNQFVQPATAEEARYPRRFASIAVVVGGALLLWSCLLGIAVLVRNHMA